MRPQVASAPQVFRIRLFHLEVFLERELVVHALRDALLEYILFESREDCGINACHGVLSPEAPSLAARASCFDERLLERRIVC